MTLFGPVNLIRLSETKREMVTVISERRLCAAAPRCCNLLRYQGGGAGDILFGTHPKGDRGAQRFSAPSRTDSRSVPTPKQGGSADEEASMAVGR
ncbi:hypothetical protein EYF80_019072 [Liparis tanakae]|uniref:Uncharacterized protein n=1 Tax=Liparis tanakae TaxID=230148 RepID=A0A4Z2HZ63_9TELE|nr:hypothetical protein EYF80_019072 [Liparis tanakae]